MSIKTVKIFSILHLIVNLWSIRLVFDTQTSILF
jgi:hypothetical protein